MASGNRLWAASDSAPLNTVSPLASSAGGAPASIARPPAAAGPVRRDGRRAARAGTGTPRTGAVSTGADAAGGAGTPWLTRAVSRGDEETGACVVCQARHGASHHSAAAIANPLWWLAPWRAWQTTHA